MHYSKYVVPFVIAKKLLKKYKKTFESYISEPQKTCWAKVWLSKATAQVVPFKSRGFPFHLRWVGLYRVRVSCVGSGSIINVKIRVFGSRKKLLLRHQQFLLPLNSLVGEEQCKSIVIFPQNLFCWFSSSNIHPVTCFRSPSFACFSFNTGLELYASHWHWTWYQNLHWTTCENFGGV